MYSGAAQVFFYDPTGAFYQLSTSLTAANGNGTSGDSMGISANGAITVFDSAASDLVADDTNAAIDVFGVVPEPDAAGAAFAAAGALAWLRRRRPRD